MKSNIKIEEKFKPVTLEITFESKKELELFIFLCGTNVRIPQYLESIDGSFCGTKENKIILQELLGVLYRQFVNKRLV